MTPKQLPDRIHSRENESRRDRIVTGEMSEEKDKHDTLKYHLLGPSLTKAGQDAVDQTKVSEIIYNASKGSKYFNNEEVKDKVLTEKITRILAKKANLEKLDLSHDLRKADDLIASLEASRDLSQIIVHVDCDAFYAAVEELDRPELKDVPMAVGKGVLTTCNYHARKFGCRSGMAGFVAMKLCPQLICLPLNFEKYGEKAREVREVFAMYDPNFESASMDEAYLNITTFCKEHNLESWEAVTQLRADVFAKASITVSAGIGANAKIAKICSNRNKPNGQFAVPIERAAIMSFMKHLPTRKVNGIGRVFERELDAIGIKTCGDIYSQRAYLTRLFGEKAFRFMINCHLGLGRTDIRPSESYTRKSVGTEKTFHDCSDVAELHAKLRHTAESLAGDLERTKFKARTLCLKIKLHTYEVLTRQTCPPKAICEADDLFTYGLPMLTRLQAERPGLKLRLMGLRATHLISTKKVNAEAFFGTTNGDTSILAKGVKRSADGEEKKRDPDDEWEVWPEAEFEESARMEREDDAEEALRCSQELEAAFKETENEQLVERPRKSNPPNTEKERTMSQKEDVWLCPICSRSQPADDKAFNAHVDFCLSKGVIRDAIKETGGPEKPESEGAAVENGRKSTDREVTKDSKRRQLFFSR